MKKAVFKSQSFYIGVIIMLSLLLLWNAYVVFLGGYSGFIPIVIQLVLLFLLLKKKPLLENRFENIIYSISDRCFWPTNYIRPVKDFYRGVRDCQY